MKDFDRKALLNEQYKGRDLVQTHAPSLMSFLSGEPLQSWLLQQLNLGPWAELGCGAFSIFEKGDELVHGLAQKGDLYGHDLSSEAISQAPSSGINYKETDCVATIPDGPYAFILDGHYLHCLSSLPEVFQALGTIWSALQTGGLYAGEVMTAHKNLSFDHDLYFDHKESVLYKDDLPLRTILEAREWEQLFKDAGFEIQYFVCQASIKMIPQRERTIPMSGDPECLRFVIKRPSLKDD